MLVIIRYKISDATKVKLIKESAKSLEVSNEEMSLIM